MNLKIMKAQYCRDYAKYTFVPNGIFLNLPAIFSLLQSSMKTWRVWNAGKPLFHKI